MQYALNMDAGTRSNPLLVVDYLLRRSIDIPNVTYRLDPVTQLVKAMLGARTTGGVSVEALQTLRARFPDWASLCDADPRDVFDAIRDVNHAERKAAYLVSSFRRIRHERGAMDLSHLATLSVPQGLLWLERLPGVGRKISASVLNLSSLHRRALVIDTHHLRILQRLGLVGAQQDYRAAYDRIMPQLPQHWCATRIDDHHRRFKRLGQTTCQHWIKDCGSCPLNTVCATARGQPATGWGDRNSSPAGSPHRAARG